MIETDDLVLTIDRTRYDNTTFDAGSNWESGEIQTFNEDTGNEFPGGGQQVRLIYEPSGSTIFEASADFSA